MTPQRERTAAFPVAIRRQDGADLPANAADRDGSKVQRGPELSELEAMVSLRGYLDRRIAALRERLRAAETADRATVARVSTDATNGALRGSQAARRSGMGGSR